MTFHFEAHSNRLNPELAKLDEVEGNKKNPRQSEN